MPVMSRFGSTTTLRKWTGMCVAVKWIEMTLDEVLRLVRVGDAFYRESKPEVLYERIGTLIERDGLGWATLRYSTEYAWDIIPERNVEADNRAADWILQRDERLRDFDPKARSPKLSPLITEKTRHGWTFYDQTEPAEG